MNFKSNKGSINTFLIFLVLGIIIIIGFYSHMEKQKDIMKQYPIKPFASFRYDASESSYNNSSKGILLGIVFIIIGFITLPFNNKKNKNNISNSVPTTKSTIYTKNSKVIDNSDKIICNKCNYPNDTEDRFCIKCGNKIEK